MSKVSVQPTEDGRHAVIVTSRTADAGGAWWLFAARTPAWTVDHLTGDEIEGLDFDLVRATRICKTDAGAKAHATRAANALARDRAKNFTPALPSTPERKESPDARIDPQEGADDRD